MLGLDLRTIVLISGVMGALMAVVLFFLRRSYPSSIHGLSEWAAAPAILFVATLLFAARGTIPSLFSVLIANLLLLLGFALFYLGSQRFFGLVPALRIWGGVFLASAAVLTWYTFIQPNYGARLAVVSFLMASIFVAQALLVWRHGGKAFSARLIIVVALFESGILAIRCVTALTEPVGLGLFDASSTQTVYLVANSFTMLTFTVGLVLMATDRLRAELEQLATHDPLTNALTRRALIDACEQELERCRRHDREMSLLLLDLDHFKLINDTHGHLAGDRVLRDLVTRISALLRSPDQLGRFGGEEFVVLLPETGLDEALVVAERIRKEAALAKDLPTCTVSIGVATHRPDDALVDALLARADAALYKAKALGRNRVATA